MIAWLEAKLGKWAAIAATVLAAIGAALVYGLSRGARGQAARDAAQQAAERIAAAKVAQQTYVDAAKAATDVQRTAQAQPAPDTDKRNDFDTHF